MESTDRREPSRATSASARRSAPNPFLDDVLAYAAYHGPPEAVDLLLAHGARADARGWTPLLFAIKGKQPKIVAQLLARGADPNAVDRAGRTSALLLAAELGRVEIISQLLDKGANADVRPPEGADLERSVDVNKTDGFGRTALCAP